MNTIRNIFKCLIMAILLISSVEPMKRKREYSPDDQISTKKQNTTPDQISIPKESNDKKITLQGQNAGIDNHVTLTLEEAMFSTTLKNMIDDLGQACEETIIPVDIPHDVLVSIVDCLKIIREKYDQTTHPLNIDEIKNKLLTYINDHATSLGQLYRLFLAANYLDLKDLFDVCAEKYREYYSDKQEAEILSNLKYLLPSDLGHYVAQGKDDKQNQSIASWLMSEYSFSLNDGNDRQITFSPDGSLFISADGHGSIKIWNVIDWTCRSTLNSKTDGVNALSFNPNGKIFASGSGGQIKIWELIDLRCIATFNDNYIRSLCFSKDGQTLVSATSNKSIHIWDIKNEACIATLNGHTNYVNSVCLSPDGKTLASASGDATVRIWDIENKTCIATLRGHTLSVHSVVFSPDGKTLISGSADKTIKIWDVSDWTCTATLNDHANSVYTLSISPCGKILVSGSQDKIIKIWDLEKKICRATLDTHPCSPHSLCFSPNGKILASGFNLHCPTIWDMEILSFFTNQITIEQNALIKIIMEKNLAQEVLDLTQEKYKHLLEIFNTLPDKPRNLLKEQSLVILQ